MLRLSAFALTLLLPVAACNGTGLSGPDQPQGISAVEQAGFEGGAVLDDTATSMPLVCFAVEGSKGPARSPAAISLTSDPDSKFTIVNDCLVLNAALDFATKASHAYTVRACNTHSVCTGATSGDLSGTITVLDAGVTDPGEPAPDPNVVAFGDSTLANAGAVLVTVTGDPIVSASIDDQGTCTNYVISSSGYLSRTVAGAVSCSGMDITINGTSYPDSVTISPVADTYSVRDTTQMEAALNAASGGDTVCLRDGSYGGSIYTLQNHSYASDVTLTYCDTHRGPLWQKMNITNVSHLVISGLEFGLPSALTFNATAANIQLKDGVDNVTIDDNYLHGLEGQDTVPGGRCFIVKVGVAAHDFAFQNNDCRWVQTGIEIRAAAYSYTVDNNVYEDIGRDAMQACGTDATITNNTGQHRSRRYDATEHRDFFQAQCDLNGFTITGNFIGCYDDDPATAHHQGLFFNDGTYINGTVANNIICTAHDNGIGLNEQRGTYTNIAVSNNTILGQSYSAGHISLYSGNGNTSTNNVSTPTSEGGAGVDGSGDIKLQLTNAAGSYYWGDYYSDPVDTEVDIADFEPTNTAVGSACAGAGAYERIWELIGTPCP